MADNVYRYGFKWVASLTAGDERPAVIPMRVASGFTPTASATSNLRQGDPVILLSTGYIRDAAAGEPVFGIIDGIGQYYDGSRVVKKSSLPYGTTYTAGDAQESIVYVIPAVGQVFEVCNHSTLYVATRAAAVGYIGLCADHTYSLVSAPYLNPALDSSAAPTAATAQWRIIELSRDPGVDYTGKYVPFRVTVQEPEGTAAGVTSNTAT
jgi:hypothetical protein